MMDLNGDLDDDPFTAKLMDYTVSVREYHLKLMCSWRIVCPIWMEFDKLRSVPLAALMLGSAGC